MSCFIRYKNQIDFCSGPIYFIGLAMVFSLILQGCAPSLDPGAREKTAHEIATHGKLQKQIYSTQIFDLQSYGRISPQAQEMSVYIEGDGLAFLSRGHISANPTPLNPIALHLAAVDSSENVLYLARPCQYKQGPNCRFDVWTSARFSENVIAAYHLIFDQLRKDNPFLKGFHLVGYSGGGGIAAILTAQRTDVLSLRTIAGNVNTDLFVKIHNLTPMTGSINPASLAQKTARVPQIHFIGGADRRVPVEIAESFVTAASSSCAVVRVIQNNTHIDGWSENWHSLVQEKPACRSSFIAE